MCVCLRIGWCGACRVPATDRHTDSADPAERDGRVVLHSSGCWQWTLQPCTPPAQHRETGKRVELACIAVTPEDSGIKGNGNLLINTLCQSGVLKSPGASVSVMRHLGARLRGLNYLITVCILYLCAIMDNYIINDFNNSEESLLHSYSSRDYEFLSKRQNLTTSFCVLIKT